MELQCPFCGLLGSAASFSCHIYSETKKAETFSDCPSCVCLDHICPFCGFIESQLEEFYDHVRACPGYAAALLVGDVEKVHFYWGDET